MSGGLRGQNQGQGRAACCPPVFTGGARRGLGSSDDTTVPTDAGAGAR